MCEFIAARLPIITTAFGARGFHVDDGRTGFVFEKEALAPVLSRWCAASSTRILPDSVGWQTRPTPATRRPST